MSFISSASNASIWRGYEYFEAKKVLSWKQTDGSTFEGEVAGSGKEPYHVIINAQHPKKSTCNCPHAEGNRIVCKHKIALFFTIFPKEAESYLAEVEENEKEEERIRQENYEFIVKYVNSLTKKELQEALIEALLEADERDFD